MTQPCGSKLPPPETRNRYDRMEWAGALGDLGTLIPFVAAYVGVLKLDPFGVLFAFGVAMLACGMYYKTPFPVQPMKAIGAVAALQAVQTAMVTPAAVYSAALVTGVIWLALGLTGWVSRIVRLVPPAVVIGIVLGLGFGFMLQGVKMMQGDWLIAAVSATGTLLLMGSRRIPAMFVLLAFGAVVGALRDPQLIAGLAEASVGFRAPQFSLAGLSWNQFWVGLVLLALPQVPLTLGNAVIAIRQENNRLFPHRPVTEDGVAVSTGLMNLLGSAVGGIPMCHGAGGMASHVAFGARTGGSVVILGSCCWCWRFFSAAASMCCSSCSPARCWGSSCSSPACSWRSVAAFCPPSGANESSCWPARPCASGTSARVSWSALRFTGCCSGAGCACEFPLALSRLPGNQAGAGQADRHAGDVPRRWPHPVDSPQPAQRHGDIHPAVGSVDAAGGVVVQCQQPDKQRQAESRGKQQPGGAAFAEPEKRQITARNLGERSGDVEQQGSHDIPEGAGPVYLLRPEGSRSAISAAKASAPSAAENHRAPPPKRSSARPNNQGDSACAKRAGTISRPWRAP